MVIKNTHQRGITREEATDVLPLERGTSFDRGVPKLTEDFLAAQGELQGIPMPGPGMMPDAEDMPPAHCAGTTKKGTPCKAYAITNSVFCVAHSN